MLDYAQEAVAMGRGRSRPELDQDRMLNLSLVRLLEVIGEASNRVTTETRQQHPNIAWPQIVGLRNRLIHGYDTIDFDILWSTLQASRRSLAN